MVDVNKIICELYHKIFNDKVMIDVGALGGSTVKPFYEKKYTIYAFEPNPVFYNKLASRYLNNNITLEMKCVSNKDEDNLPFYLSNESVGISSLTPFHTTHKKADYVVSSIRLDNYMKSKHINHVNYLKIDTEGHDYFVLQSYPWKLDKPDIILCEFEDLKTKKKLNYTWKDQIKYLTKLGYTIIISEWFPIIKYGTKHKFRGFKEYPCELHHQDAWGDFICFKDYSLLEIFKEKNIDKFIYKINHITVKNQIFSNKSHLSKNKTIFIMGNGPSLAECSFSVLKNYNTFGMNSAYKKYKELNFYPTYFGCHDPKLITYHYERFRELLYNSKIQKFFFSIFNTSKEIQFTKADLDHPKFQKIKFIYDNNYNHYKDSDFNNYNNVESTGANAVIMSIIMGYKNIILLGCDCNYTERIKESELNNKQTKELIINKTPETNNNYWFSNYQEKGEIYSVPQGDTSHMRAWRIVKEATNYHNVRIVNCSKSSNIPYFDKSTFDAELQYIKD